MIGFTEIAEGFWYEAATGLPWSTRRRGTLPNNAPMKRITGKNKGYYTVQVDGKTKKWHRLVWNYFHGPILGGLHIDHKNNIRDDNRLSNLQLLSQRDNNRSQLKSTNNTSGCPGVYWNRQSKKWKAQIQIDGKNKHLGYFTDIQQAADAYIKAKIQYHGQDSVRFL